MNIAFVNGVYRQRVFSGGNAHVYQFMTQVTTAGHVLWTREPDEHPSTRRLPRGRAPLAIALGKMDVIYLRIEDRPVGACRLGTPPFRALFRRPVFVWEFNTIPGYAVVRGGTQADVEDQVGQFRRLAGSCDLAIGVSRMICDYLRTELGFRRVRCVTNASDPAVFQPDADPFPRASRRADVLNVCWIGSADLEWHDFNLIRRTAALVEGYYPDVSIRFHIIGTGLGSMGDMPESVVYHGADEYHNVPRWLAGMDVGLCAYRPGPADFSSPLKLFDYMASGLAVVSTPQPQVREVLSEINASDLVCERADPDCFAARLVGLARNRERTRAIGLRARALVETKYNWASIVARTLAEIEATRRELGKA